MRKLGMSAVVVVMLALLAPETPAQGPRWRGSGGWGPGTQYGRMYDSRSVETLKGEVLRVESVTPLKGMVAGVHLVVKTDREEISVHLGPAWYVENQDVKIAPGDAVEVKGARATVGGKPAVIAAEVRKGDQTLRLRDEAGFPVWSGWRRS
jgi:hypothetical protein